MERMLTKTPKYFLYLLRKLWKKKKVEYLAGFYRVIMFLYLKEMLKVYSNGRSLVLQAQRF